MQNHSALTFATMTSLADDWIKKHDVLDIMEDVVDYLRAHILFFMIVAIASYSVTSWIGSLKSLVRLSKSTYAGSYTACLLP
jgi:hypothetical protein